MSARGDKRPRRRGLRLAVFALLVAGVAAIGWAASGSGSSYRVTAVFSSVNGLVPGAPVRVAGLDVGEVVSVELGERDLPEVVLEIDDDFRLREGAVANLRAGSASGQTNRFVELSRGSGEELEDGATLGTAHTDQPVEVERILSTLDPRTRERVSDTLRGLAKATGGHGDDLAGALRKSADALEHTAALLGQVNADGEALRTAVTEGGALAAELAGSSDRLAGTADELAAALATAARRHGELGESARLLPESLRAANSALARFESQVPELRGLVSAAKPGLEELVPFAKALRPAVDAARPALEEASGLVSAADEQIGELDPLLRASEPALKELAPLLRAAGPILDEARVRTPDFFSFFANWADFTGVYDANGHAARVGVVLGVAPTNTIDGDEARAGHLKPPFVRTPGVLGGEPWLDYRDSFLSTPQGGDE